MSEHQELIKDFLLESYENLDRLDRDFVELEKNPADRETLSSIFRTIHTIKGTCGFLGFTKLESVTHVGESLLSRLRDGELRLTSERTSVMLAMVDAVREMLRAIELTGSEGDGDYTALIARLTVLNRDDPATKAASPAASAVPPTMHAEAEEPGDPGPVETAVAEEPGGFQAVSDAVLDAALNAALAAGSDPPTPAPPDVGHLAAEVAHVPPTEFPKPADVVVDGQVLSGQKVVTSASSGADPAAVARTAETTAAAGSAVATTPSPVSGAAATLATGGGSGGGGAAAAHPPEGEGRSGSVADSAIRVDVNLLDKLMNLVGELVLARNQILQFTASSENSALGATTQRLNLITTELQEGVMKTRMQPINIIWQKFPRVVRDLSTQFGKKIRLEMEGKDTELDKTIVEAIKDPLTHIVRNSIDHGIETPEVRLAKGKPEEGRLFLRAYHEGGQVNIEIIDDGAGINPDKVKAKAVEKGLITPEQAARMGDREAVNLIFLPGFSTAEKITNVSGRGVGMDVVKTNIEKIGGTVDISTRPGEGTTLRIKIPLTLAIIPALLVGCAGERFAIPQVSLLELVRLDGDNARQQIEMVHGSPVFRLRGNLLPLTYLSEQLRLPRSPGSDAVNIVVLHADGRQFGLIVDEISDTEEIVVKPLSKQLKGLTAFAGATIMGDGRVALILDVMGLAKAANLVGEHRDSLLASATVAAGSAAANARALLLLQVGPTRRMAVELSKVSRLEEFPADSVEHSGEFEVVQYRGKIMPLIRLASLFPDASGAAPQAAETINVVVYAFGQRNVGLVVDSILDITEEALEIDLSRARNGIRGSAIIQGKVTELLDIETVVRDQIGDETPSLEPTLLAA